MPKLIDLDDAVTYLRELLYLNKQELLREVRSYPDLDKAKRTDIIAFAFERKFDPNVRPPVRRSGKAFCPIYKENPKNRG